MCNCLDLLRKHASVFIVLDHFELISVCSFDEKVKLALIFELAKGKKISCQLIKNNGQRFFEKAKIR